MKPCKDTRTYCKSCGGNHADRLAKILVMAEEIEVQFGGLKSKSSRYAAKTARKIMKLCRGKQP